MLLGDYGGAGAAPQLAPPPSKRAKVEMRSAPKQAEAADAVRAALQSLFGLRDAPPDAADKLHRLVDDRKQSWAYGDDRSLTYLLACYQRLCASDQ